MPAATARRITSTSRSILIVGSPPARWIESSPGSAPSARKTRAAVSRVIHSSGCRGEQR